MHRFCSGWLVLDGREDKKAYALTGNLAVLNAGEQVAIKGKKGKDSTGKRSFQVEKVARDLGACQP
jgi:hypothetical protein